MKLTAFIMLVTCLQTSATGVAQQTITFSGKEVSLENVFAAIKKQTNYKFFFNIESIHHARAVTIEVRNASIEQVLNVALKDQPFTYTIKGRTVFIIQKKEEEKSSSSVSSVQGDPVTVSGRVVDDQGQPLVGANVKIKGTTIGVTTDKDGLFKLTNVEPDATLEISFVGHETQVIPVRGKSFFAVNLAQKLSLLDETQVIAYGQTTRRFATGNVATVKAADIEKQPVQNPLLALQGRVPGVEITQLTGLPGGGVTARIQGRNSINAGLDPLIVIDGVPYPSQLFNSGDLEGIVQYGSPLNYINTADIESIDVLKDADATAIYGSRAANGAILITTKKGKAGRPKLNANLQQGWGKVTRHVNMMNTRQYLDMRYEALRNDGKIPNINSDYDLTLWDTTRYTDWQKVLIGGTAHYTNVNAGISGGTQGMQYLVGANYNRQTTVFPGNFDDKAGGLHFNINGGSANQRLQLRLSGSYSYDQNFLPNVDLTSTAIVIEPNAPALYNDNGTLNWAPNAAGSSTLINPLAYTQGTDFKNITRNLVSSANLSYRIFSGLMIRTSFGYNNMVSELYSASRLESYRPEFRPYLARTAIFGNRNMSSWIMEPQLTYSGKLGKGKLDGLLGTSIQKNSANYLSILGSGFPTDQLMKTLRAATATQISSSTSFFNRFNAIFGRLNYNWNDKYLISLTARRDGSNKFGDKNKFHNFGSAGLGWIFSEEKWLRSFSFLSFGKLRASYGTTGNDQIPDFSYLSLYNIDNPGILYQNGIGLYATNIPNPYLQWEETRKLQGGVDLGFVHDRIILGVTYALNRSSNQLIAYALPALTGFNSITKNFPALIQNTSWEFTLHTVNLKIRDLTWTSNFNFTRGRNKLLSFPDIELTSYKSGNLGVIVGQPLGVSLVYQYAGVNPASGAYLTLDKNDNPSISGTKQIPLFTRQVRYYGGFVNNIQYKRFQLDFLFQFVRQMGPRDLYYWNGTMPPGAFSSSLSNQPVTVLNRWQKPGDNRPISRYSTFPAGSVNNFPATDVGYSYDASYIRLKNVSVSWRLPDSWLKTAKLQSGLLYFRGENLATITNYSGIDPESLNTGSLPPLQIWTVGANLEF